MSSSLVAFETGRTLTHRVGSFDRLASLQRGSQSSGENQPEDLRNEPTPEANGYGVGSTARLKLRQ